MWPSSRNAKSQPRLSLDIGTRLIKAVEVSHEGGQAKLTKCGFSEIDLTSSPNKVTLALRSLIESLNPSTKDVNISLSAPSVVVRSINMPKMKETELKNSIRFEAEKYIPFDINEVYMDATILGGASAESGQMRVVLAAVKKDAVTSRLTMLRDFGLTTSLVDVDGFACFNAFCASQEGLDETKSNIILNIGFTQTNVVIARGKRPFLTRDIQFGGKDIAGAISKALQVKEKEAEKLIFNSKNKESEVFEASKAVLAVLADELRLSCGYYEDQHGSGIDDIYISGGISKFGAIYNYMEEYFGVKPKMWDPFSKFEVSTDIDAKFLDNMKFHFAVCAGLALRG